MNHEESRDVPAPPPPAPTAAANVPDAPSSAPAPALLQVDLASFHLREDEQAVIADESPLLLARELPSDARSTYERLEEAAETGVIPEDLLEPLQNLVAVGLESGRIRKIHAPHAEMTAVRLYGRLPRGKSYRASVAAANEALQTLNGGVIRSASLEAGGPGACTLEIEAGDWRIRIRITRAGVSVQSVEAVL